MIAMCIVSTYSEAGGHAVNEDAFAVYQQEGLVLCALADGQGGVAGGGRAAQLACDKVMELTTKLPKPTLIDSTFWRQCLEIADQAVTDDSSAGRTTLIGLSIVDGKLTGASNGDSMVLLCSAGGKFKDVTAQQAKNPPIGSGAAVCIPFGTWLTPPWKVLVMSDGVWKYIGHERLRDLTQQQSGDKLIAEVLHEVKSAWGGKLPDDFTIVVLESSVTNDKPSEE